MRIVVLRNSTVPTQFRYSFFTVLGLSAKLLKSADCRSARLSSIKAKVLPSYFTCLFTYSTLIYYYYYLEALSSYGTLSYYYSLGNYYNYSYYYNYYSDKPQTRYTATQINYNPDKLQLE